MVIIMVIVVYPYSLYVDRDRPAYRSSSSGGLTVRRGWLVVIRSIPPPKAIQNQHGRLGKSSNHPTSPYPAAGISGFLVKYSL